MANKQIHLAKYKKNKALANSELISKEENNDWKVTMIYYTALHIVDSYLANSNTHPKSHEVRKKVMACNKYLENIIDTYNLLEAKSRKSRYDCLIIKSKDVKKSLDLLNRIEEYFQVS